MPSIKDYSRAAEVKTAAAPAGQSIWTRPIYIHIMPQLQRKVSHKTAAWTIAIWTVVAVLAATYFLVK